MVIFKRPVLLLLILVGIGVTLGIFIKDFKIEASAETLLTQGNKDYIKTQVVGQRFGSDDFILVALKAQQQPIFSEKNLVTLMEIGEKLKTLDEVENITHIANVPIFAINENIFDALDPEGLAWQAKRYSPDEMRTALTSHPIYEGTLYNEKQDSLGLQLVFKNNPKMQALTKEIVELKQHLLERDLSEKEQRELESLTQEKSALSEELSEKRNETIDQVRSIVAEYNDGYEVFLGGNSLLAKQLIDIIRADLVVFGLVIIGIVAVLLLILLRSFAWVLLPLLTCGFSVVVTLGLLGLLGLKVTVISTNVIALQIILTLAVVIHLIFQYREAEDKAGAAQPSNGKPHAEHASFVKNMVSEKFKPCVYASVTTAIGFASLVFSGIQPIVSFGWMMVLSLVVTMFSGLLFFPALLLSVIRKPIPTRPFPALLNASVEGSLVCVKKGKRWITLVSAGFMALGVAGCFFLSAETSFLNYFKKSTDVNRELSYIDKNFGGSTPLDVVYDIPRREEPEDLQISAEDIQVIEEIQHNLKQNEAIGDVMSVADFARVARVVRGKPLTEFEVSVIYKMLGDDMKERLFGPYYDEQAQQLRMTLRVKDTTEDLDRKALKAFIEKSIEDAGVEKDSYQLTNLFVLYQDILQRLMQSQFISLAIVYACMLVTMLVIFRSLKIAIISMVPNMLTVAIVMGVMGWAHIPLDIMTITIAAVAMGISVDDTIHYIHRYNEKKRESKALELTHRSVGYALICTTTVIVIGFGALMFSSFVPSMVFGLLTAGSMVVAVAADMLLLPVLLEKYLHSTTET